MRMWLQAARIVHDDMQRWRPDRKLHIKCHHKDVTRRLCIARGITYKAFVVRPPPVSSHRAQLARASHAHCVPQAWGVRWRAGVGRWGAMHTAIPLK